MEARIPEQNDKSEIIAAKLSGERKRDWRNEEEMKKNITESIRSDFRSTFRALIRSGILGPAMENSGIVPATVGNNISNNTGHMRRLI